LHPDFSQVDDVSLGEVLAARSDEAPRLISANRTSQNGPQNHFSGNATNQELGIFQMTV
jgi:hypothetical protein